MQILIMGTRGIPANHGGFEACVENLAPFLASKSFEVSVFRQIGSEAEILTSYKNVTLINFIVGGKGTLGTIFFDVKSTFYVIKNHKPNTLILTFGYPTAFLFVLLNLFGFTHIVNMDGLEWKRQQFGLMGKAWYWLNEKIAVATAQVLIADHPKIRERLQRINFLKRRIYTVAYSADDIRDKHTKVQHLGSSLQKVVLMGKFMLIMARLESDNQILELIQAFSRKAREFNLIVAGKLDLKRSNYHKALVSVASDQVKFVGGVYDKNAKQFLRNNSIAYLHGHTVGGTNPSLVEALGSRSPIIAHDNEFNRGVAQDGAIYFSTEDQISEIFDKYTEADMQDVRKRADVIFREYTHEKINAKYLRLINESACQNV